MCYICECGREFTTKNSLKSHYRFCKVHKPQKKYDANGKCISKSKYKVDENLYRCECGREFNCFQGLNGHFSHCDFHHNCCGTKRKGHTSEITKSMCWQNKSDTEISQIHISAGNTYKNKLASGELKHNWKGRKHTEESKEKTRLSTLKYLEQTAGDVQARYSIKGCRYIDDLNNKFGWNLQHAENGGEVSMFGYFFDGYDKERNIVFEYDEPYHYADVENNILKEKDIERQNYIIKQLNCEFYRYNEKLDKFYKAS